MLNSAQLREFKTMLDERYAALREEIRQDLLESEDQHFIDLAGQVHDIEEESVATFLVDLEQAINGMHINEVRDIEAARLRMKMGSYGRCTDCGDDVAPERLRAYPTAKRCRSCQQNYERNHAGNATPSM
jgi:RNA polymerase-binding transcription factor DksA